MKLIISWNPQKAPNTLGLLVGMLVLGSSLPYLIRALGISFDWQYTVILTSGLCYIAGITIYLMGDGPHLIINKKPSFRLLDQFSELSKNKKYVSFSSSDILRKKYRIKSKIISNLAKDNITIYKR